MLRFLVRGLDDTILQFLEGRLYTFACSACGEIGFRVGRHGLGGESLYCSHRCNGNPSDTHKD